MLKRLILYPFMFIVYLISYLLVYNLEQVDPVHVLRPLLALLLAAGLVMLLFHKLFKDWHYAGYLVFLALMFLFAFGYVNRELQEHLPWDHGLITMALLVFWLGILVVLGSRKLWLWLGGAERITPLLNLSLVLALILQGFSSIKKISGEVSITRQIRQDTQLSIDFPATFDCATRPDIYYIILDGYGRTDILKKLYHVDNTSFLDFLNAKGFYVAGQSHSNYIQTIFSIPSALNFTYLESEPVGMSGLDYFTSLVIDNQVMHLLKQCGYRTVAFQTSFTFTNHPKVDVYLSSDHRLTQFEGLLLVGSPLELLLDQLGLVLTEFGYPAHRSQVLFDFEQLKSLPEMHGPKLVFAHIISPHPPFVFDANGNPIQPDRDYSIGDGDDFLGTWDEYQKGYTGQVQFIDWMLEETIEAILERSSQPPIIILQGDHGPGGFLNWFSPQRTCLWERTSILNAYYLPAGVDKDLYPTISPVNSFRVILNSYFGTHLDLLPDRTFFTSHRLIRQIIDITDERNSMRNCPVQ